MQPRYFIGITLPDELSQNINAIQRELFLRGIVIDPLTPHITLLHPNTMQTLAPLHFVPKIKKVAKEILPITIRLTHSAMFDKRVLHIAVDSPEILTLRQRLVDLLPDKVRAQYEIGRDFAPHVTLVQAKPKQDLPPELIHKFKRQIDPLLPYTFQATRLAQFTWIHPRTYKITPI